jgi:hypothetical protein
VGEGGVNTDLHVVHAGLEREVDEEEVGSGDGDGQIVVAVDGVLAKYQR